MIKIVAFTGNVIDCPGDGVFTKSELKFIAVIKIAVDRFIVN